MAHRHDPGPRGHTVITLTVPHSLQPGGKYLQPHYKPGLSPDALAEGSYRYDTWLVTAVDGQEITVVPYNWVTRLLWLAGLVKRR
jgi:hypothetical protein